MPISTDDGAASYEHEARREAAPVVAVGVGLLVMLALVSRAERWEFLALQWWIWIVLAIPALLVSVDLWIGTRPTGYRRTRPAALVLLGVVFVGNLTGLVILVAALITTRAGDLGGGELLFTAAAIWTTNVIVFGIAFWEVDRGGPVARLFSNRVPPDFRFPQEESVPAAGQTWRPSVWDYLYVSLTCATAFSPTDAMPLTLRAKLLMGMEAVFSLILIVLVTARAVNVLGS